MKNQAQNLVDKVFPDSYKKSKMIISPDQQSEMLQFLFQLYVQVEDRQIILKLNCWTLAFCKKRRGWFLKKNIYLVNWPNFIVSLPLLLEILGNMYIAIVFKPVCDVIKFEINFISQIKPFFLHDQKVKTKI